MSPIAYAGGVTFEEATPKLAAITADQTAGFELGEVVVVLITRENAAWWYAHDENGISRIPKRSRWVALQRVTP
jgi:hypothetical protein